MLELNANSSQVLAQSIQLLTILGPIWGIVIAIALLPEILKILLKAIGIKPAEPEKQQKQVNKSANAAANNQVNNYTRRRRTRKSEPLGVLIVQGIMDYFGYEVKKKRRSSYSQRRRTYSNRPIVIIAPDFHYAERMASMNNYSPSTKGFTPSERMAASLANNYKPNTAPSASSPSYSRDGYRGKQEIVDDYKSFRQR